MANWRDHIDPVLKGHLESQIKESYKYKRAYLSSENPINAQLWVAVANLSKQLFNTELKLNYLERTLQEIIASKKEITKVKKVITKKKKTTRKSMKKF